MPLALWVDPRHAGRAGRQTRAARAPDPQHAAGEVEILGPERERLADPKPGAWGSRRKALGDLRINAPKSNRQRRVDMSEQLARVLSGHVSVLSAEAVVAGKAAPEWLFVGPDGRPLTPGAFWQNVWQPLMKRSGVRYRKPHALRHTVASLLLGNGESPAYVKDQMGHSSIKITVDTYGHLIPGSNRAAVDRLDDASIRIPAASDAFSGYDGSQRGNS